MSLLLLFVGCSGGGEAEVKTPAPVQGPAVPAALVDQSWQVRLARDDARGAFEGRASWVAWYGGRRTEALAAFVSEGDAAALARVHADYACLYRDAALAAAAAAEEVYGKMPEPTDPVDVAALLGIGARIRGDAAGAGRLEASKASKDPAIKARVGQWLAAPAIPAELAPGEPRPGELPGADRGLWAMPLQGEPGSVSLGDPGDLVQLALWHEATAKAADPASAAAVDVVLAPHRLPIEAAPPPGPASLSDTWLFMSAWTSGEDLAFVAALRPGEAAGALAGWAPKSAYAAMVQACTKDKIDVDCMVDASIALGRAIEDGMERAAGKVDSFHRPFADHARAGVLRAAAAWAGAAGDADAMGRLNVLALDRNLDKARDPVFLMQLAAWDVGNRNTPRAEELLHELKPSVPALASARSVVDALHIRLSRNAAPGLPMH